MSSRVGMRLSRHHHSGKVLPRHHTSYPALALLLILCGLLLLSLSFAASGFSSVAVGAIVPYPSPNNPPTINSPVNGANLSKSPVTVSGSCKTQLIVEVFRNGTFAGSVACQSSAYSLDVDLQNGSNELVARQYTPDNQASPDSNHVVVHYAPPAPAPTSPATAPGPSTSPSGPAAPPSPDTNPLKLSAEAPFIFSNDSRKVYWPIKISGGDGPYAVNVEWGDSLSDLLTRLEPGIMPLVHTYRNGGSYQMSLNASDSKGRRAHLSLASVIDLSASPNHSSPFDIGRLLIAWPLYAVMVLSVVSFWLGEKQALVALMNRGVKL